MAIKKESIDRFFDYDVLLDSRTILVADATDDGVDNAMANRFLKAMTILEQSNSNPIRVMLKTIGGCIHNGAAIYDAIANSPCHVTIEVYGAAMSMGGVILQSGDVRVMTPSSLLMLHDGTFSSNDNTRTFENWAMVSKILRKQMYQILASRSHYSVKYWERKCQSDYILTPEQALAAGLIDKIAGPVIAA